MAQIIQCDRCKKMAIHPVGLDFVKLTVIRATGNYSKELCTSCEYALCRFLNNEAIEPTLQYTYVTGAQQTLNPPQVQNDPPKTTKQR